MLGFLIGYLGAVGLIALIRWLMSLPCKHSRMNIKKWVEDGVPMQRVSCPDCGFYDCGHVYADPNDWED